MENSSQNSVSLILKSEIDKSKTRKNLIRLFIKIVMVIILFYIFFGFVFGIKRMNTSFMSPNITEGDLLVYYRIDRNFELGDVVLIKNNNSQDVYRIVAKEGQTVDVNEEGKLTVDGYPEEHQVFYLTESDENSQIKFPYQVEEGKYFVMNDYRLEKSDSRTFGTIYKDSILGKVIGKLQIRNI